MTQLKQDREEPDERDRRERLTSLVLLLATTAVLLALGIVLHLGTARADTTMWSARMTVGFGDTLDFPFQAGYYDVPDFLDDTHRENMGSLDNPNFTHGGVDYAVAGIYYADLDSGIYNPEFDCGRHCLFLHVDRPLPESLTLQMEDAQYDLLDADEEDWGEVVYMWQLEGFAGWSEGDEVQVSLIARGQTEE